MAETALSKLANALRNGAPMYIGKDGHISLEQRKGYVLMKPTSVFGGNQSIPGRKGNFAFTESMLGEMQGLSGSNKERHGFLFGDPNAPTSKEATFFHFFETTHKSPEEITAGITNMLSKNPDLVAMRVSAGQEKGTKELAHPDKDLTHFLESHPQVITSGRLTEDGLEVLHKEHVNGKIDLREVKEKELNFLEAKHNETFERGRKKVHEVAKKSFGLPEPGAHTKKTKVLKRHLR